MREQDALALGGYGKLPFWPEYLEAGLVSPTARALREWLHRGAEQARLDASGPVGGPGRTIRRRRFVVGLPGSAELVAGLIGPSADQGGLRAFPFVLFAHVPRRLFGREHALAPLALARTWAGLDECWSEVVSVDSREAFLDRLAGCRAPLPLERDRAEAAYEDGLEEYAAELFDPASGADLMRADRSLPGLVAEVARTRRLGPLVLPVRQEPGLAAFDATFWLRVLNHGLFWRRWTPGVFLDHEPFETTRTVVLVGDELPPEAYGAAFGLTDRGALRPAHAGAAAAGAPGHWPSYRTMFKRWCGA